MMTLIFIIKFHVFDAQKHTTFPLLHPIYIRGFTCMQEADNDLIGGWK